MLEHDVCDLPNCESAAIGMVGFPPEVITLDSPFFSHMILPPVAYWVCEDHMDFVTQVVEGTLGVLV